MTENNVADPSPPSPRAPFPPQPGAQQSEGERQPEQPPKTKQSRNRVSPKQLWELRHLLLRNMLEGGALSSVADAVALAYSVKTSMVLKQWARRGEWLPVLVNTDNAQQQLQECLLTIRQARSAAFEIVAQARRNGNLNAAVGALNHVHDSARGEIDVLQSLGKLEKAPTELNIHQENEIDVDKLSPEAAAKLVELARELDKTSSSAAQP